MYPCTMVVILVETLSSHKVVLYVHAQLVTGRIERDLRRGDTIVPRTDETRTHVRNTRMMFVRICLVSCTSMYPSSSLSRRRALASP